jgi:hypothetical protein
MSNFFMLHDALSQNNLERFKNGMGDINAIEKKDGDFLLHASIWNLKIIQELYANFGQVEQVIIQFLTQLPEFAEYISSEEQLKKIFPDSKNAFLGIDFVEVSVSSLLQITDNISYKIFKNKDLWTVTFRNLWSKREELFPNLTLCGNVENQILRIGNSNQFNQIVERLTSFDNAVKNWRDGEFSYKSINANSSLRISPESDGTMSSYGNERIFQMPSGGTEIFELHIKTGDLRFHFYPDNKNFKIFVGYIGPHLNTISN